MPEQLKREHIMECVDDTNIRIWEKVIDVQKHFNEIKAKNQSLFITILTACLAASGYLFLNKDLSAKYFEIFVIFKLYVYTIPILGAIIFTFAFYILDFSIYHTLLKGAVECGKVIETKFFNMKLSSHIIEKESEENFLTLPFRKGAIKSIKGASAKHQWFYGIIFFALIGLFLILNYCPLKDIETKHSKQEAAILKPVKIKEDKSVKIK